MKVKYVFCCVPGLCLPWEEKSFFQKEGKYAEEAEKLPYCKKDTIDPATQLQERITSSSRPL